MTISSGLESEMRDLVPLLEQPFKENKILREENKHMQDELKNIKKSEDRLTIKYLSKQIYNFQIHNWKSMW